MRHGASGVCLKRIIWHWRGPWLSLWRQVWLPRVYGDWRPSCTIVPVSCPHNQHSTSSMLTQVFAVRHVDKVGARFGFKCGYSRVFETLSGISFPNNSSEKCLFLKFYNLLLLCIVPAPCCTAAVNLQMAPFVCIGRASMWRRRHH